MIRIEYVYSDDIIIVDEESVDEAVDYLKYFFKYVEVDYEKTIITCKEPKVEINLGDLFHKIETMLIVTSFKMV